MTQEEKQLLLVALCGYLPYGLKVQEYNEEYGFYNSELDTISMKYFADNEPCFEGYWIDRIENIKPFLRPLSSMTGEEKSEYANFWCYDEYDEPILCPEDAIRCGDWLNKHHFDYRGLIDRGLAIEVTEENNPYEEK